VQLFERISVVCIKELVDVSLPNEGTLEMMSHSVKMSENQIKLKRLIDVQRGKYSDK